jgi:hypothetical protein
MEVVLFQRSAKKEYSYFTMCAHQASLANDRQKLLSSIDYFHHYATCKFYSKSIGALQLVHCTAVK